ncbi:MAG: hypothetical protein AAFU85_10330, partial [Planctomycetota bacterium]
MAATVFAGFGLGDGVLAAGAAGAGDVSAGTSGVFFAAGSILEGAGWALATDASVEVTAAGAVAVAWVESATCGVATAGVSATAGGDAATGGGEATGGIATATGVSAATGGVTAFGGSAAATGCTGADEIPADSLAGAET